MAKSKESTSSMNRKKAKKGMRIKLVLIQRYQVGCQRKAHASWSTKEKEGSAKTRKRSSSHHYHHGTLCTSNWAI